MAETFKERMKRMRLRAGLTSQQAAADAIGCGIKRGTVSMWEAPSSSVDAVGGEYLLAVAAAYRVQPGYINTGKGDDEFPWGGQLSPSPHSQPLRLDPDTLAETARTLRERFHDDHVVCDLIEHQPALFMRAYELYATRTKDERTPEMDRALAMKVADLTPQGADRDERGTPVPTEGIAKRGMGPGRKR